MGQTWRNRGQPSASLQHPQFRRPVGQSPAQPFDIRVAGPKLGFDGRDLLVAALDSCGRRPALLRDGLERPPVALQRGLLAGQRLPALYNHIDVLWVEL